MLSRKRVAPVWQRIAIWRIRGTMMEASQTKTVKRRRVKRIRSRRISQARATSRKRTKIWSRVSN